MTFTLKILSILLQSTTNLNYFEGAVLKPDKTIEKEFIQGLNFFLKRKIIQVKSKKLKF